MRRVCKLRKGILCLCLLLLCHFTAPKVLARPRDPLPPYPEARLGSWSFDELLYSYGAKQAPAEVAGTDLVEGWSGYALRREGSTVNPFAIPILGQNGQAVFAPEQGTLRFWFRPNYSSLAMGGTQPGDYARLIELVVLKDNEAELVWSVSVDPTASAIFWSGQGSQGIQDFLKADISWRAGDWHLLALSYTPSNVWLSLDGSLAAVGEPIILPPGVALTNLALVVGSAVDGSHCAQGQFDELCSFARPARPMSLACYWDAISPVAAKGPVSVEEDEAQRQAILARRAALADQTTLASSSTLMTSFNGGGGYWPDLGETNGFWLLQPVIDGTNITLSLYNADTNKSYDIYTTQVLVTNFYSSPYSSIAVTGALGQTSFTFPITWDKGFFGAAEGSDWDGDGIPNWMDANPSSTNVGALSVTITWPTNNAILR